MINISKRTLFAEVGSIYEIEGSTECHNPHGPAYKTGDWNNYWLNGKFHNIVGPAYNVAGHTMYIIQGVTIDN